MEFAQEYSKSNGEVSIFSKESHSELELLQDKLIKNGRPGISEDVLELDQEVYDARIHGNRGGTPTKYNYKDGEVFTCEVIRYELKIDTAGKTEETSVE